jgi:hypothetical protein
LEATIGSSGSVFCLGLAVAGGVSGATFAGVFLLPFLPAMFVADVGVLDLLALVSRPGLDGLKQVGVV